MSISNKFNQIKAVNQRLATFFHKAGVQYLFAFWLPVLIVSIAYFQLDIYFGSKRTLMASDVFSQLSHFYASYKNVMTGKASIFFSWSLGLGGNYFALAAYYLGGIFTPIVILFDKSAMPDALYVITLIKFGVTGLSFFYFARRTFKILPIFQLAFSTAYALNGFALAQSELLMYFDAYIYLPLIILGLINYS